MGMEEQQGRSESRAQGLGTAVRGGRTEASVSEGLCLDRKPWAHSCVQSAGEAVCVGERNCTWRDGSVMLQRQLLVRSAVLTSHNCAIQQQQKNIFPS